MRRGRVVAALLGGLAVIGTTACAIKQTSSGTTDALTGVWEGYVWDTPSSLYQGVRLVTITVVDEGVWTAASEGGQCGSGAAMVRDGLIVLDGEARDLCVPYTLKLGREYMWGAFVTSFKKRGASAVIDLKRRTD
jgi:hypothetical protein